jgi:hypothetical protein
MTLVLMLPTMKAIIPSLQRLQSMPPTETVLRTYELKEKKENTGVIINHQMLKNFTSRSFVFDLKTRDPCTEPYFISSGSLFCKACMCKID